MTFLTYIAVILAATLAASNGVFFKTLQLPPTTITFFRVTVPVVILLVYFCWKKTNPFQRFDRWFLIASLLNAGRIPLYIFSYLYTTIANAVIMSFTWPVFATILGTIFLKEKVTKRTVGLIALAFCGILLLYAEKFTILKSDDAIGMAAMLLSSIMFAATMIIFKKKLEQYSTAESIFHQNVAGVILFLPFLFINQPFPSGIQIGIASLYAFLVGLLCFILFFYALKRIPMAHYGVLSYWEVPAAILFGMAFFGEQLTWLMALGGACIIASGLLLRSSKNTTKTS